MSRFPLACALALLFTVSPVQAEPRKPEILVYTYDSLMSAGGLGQSIIPRFEARCGCKVKALPSGDGGQLLSRLQLDARRKGPTAHVVLGIDEQIWERAKPLLDAWMPPSMKEVPAELQVGEGFVPFDYGPFALIADTRKLAELKLDAPRSLADLAHERYRKKILLQDPRTSTPGLSFLLFTRQAGTSEFWKKFRGQWLTLTPGWDEAYGLFLKGEAPLVWSYTTSEAYHREHGDTEGRFRAVLFDEGQPLQIEGAAIPKGARGDVERKLARDFLEFLLSDEVQAAIPKRNWMLPVRKGTVLPESFTRLPKPRKTVRLKQSAEDISNALGDWAKVVQIGH